MTLQENIKSSYALKKEKEALEAQLEALKERIDELDARINAYNSDILNTLKEEDADEAFFEGLYANLFSKSNIGYTSEKDVIDYLKTSGYVEFVKVKTTESIDKTSLKKELKTNRALADALNSYIVKSVTEWVVVTDEENHTKMLEHIEENKK